MTLEQRKVFVNKEWKDHYERKELWANAQKEAPKIIIDLSFNSHMIERQQVSLAKQIMSSVAAIKRADKPFALHIVNCTGIIKKLLQGAGHQHWKAQVHTSSLYDIFLNPQSDRYDPKMSLTYLSPDAQQYLDELPKLNTEVLVIGGIVDKTVISQLSLGKSKDIGVGSAQLPLQKYYPETGHKILNVNTVVQILQGVRDTGQWAASIEKNLPQRKKN